MFFYLIKFILDNIAQHIPHLQPRGAHLLRDEGGRRHARRGVDLEEVELHTVLGTLSFVAWYLRNDPIHADNTVGADDVVQTQGLGLYLIAQFLLLTASIFGVGAMFSVHRNSNLHA